MKDYAIYALTGVIFLFSKLDFSLGNCNACHSGNPTACRSETSYSLCVDGSPSDEIVECPANYVCTSQPHVCYPKESAIPFCENVFDVGNRCGICNDNGQVFSCINATTVAFCFGKNQPDYSAIAHCPDNSVCDLNNPEFCSDVAQAAPSCNLQNPATTITLTETTTSTIRKPRTPLELCIDKGEPGQYKPDGDTECKLYVLCWINSDTNAMMASKRPCEPYPYFDEEKGICTTNKPAGCA